MKEFLKYLIAALLGAAWGLCKLLLVVTAVDFIMEHIHKRSGKRGKPV